MNFSVNLLIKHNGTNPWRDSNRGLFVMRIAVNHWARFSDKIGSWRSRDKRRLISFIFFSWSSRFCHDRGFFGFFEWPRCGSVSFARQSFGQTSFGQPMRSHHFKVAALVTDKKLDHFWPRKKVFLFTKMIYLAYHPGPVLPPGGDGSPLFDWQSLDPGVRDRLKFTFTEWPFRIHRIIFTERLVRLGKVK